MSAQHTSFSPPPLVIRIHEPQVDLFVCVAVDYDYDVFVIAGHPRLNIRHPTRHARFLTAVILTSVTHRGFLLAGKSRLRSEGIAGCLEM